MSGGGTYIAPGFHLPTDIIEAAQRALTKPKNFMYWGDATPENGWGWVGLASCNNEDDPINRSNMRVIYADLSGQYPDEVAIENSHSWLVGSMDELRVKVLADPDLPVTEDNLTPAFKATLKWAERLDNYILADESDYSELETEEALAAGMVMCDNTGEWEFPSDCVRAGHEHDTEVNE